MKLPLSWLADHLTFPAGTQELADCLTGLGLEVEAVEDPASRMAGFTLARVQGVEPHPAAERLSVCQVETGGGRIVQVICGAPNVRVGMLGVFAPPGLTIPGTGLHLRKSKIRGVESAGMLCSERELQLSDEHDGIIDLSGSDQKIGTEINKIIDFGEPVLELSVLPNRPDCLGIRGIARDLAARGLGVLRPLPIEPVACAFQTDFSITNAWDDRAACPLFAGRIFRGVRNGPSPEWLVRKLESIGLRPISALVDITNYLTHDVARPLHVFDLKKLSGNGIVIRPGRAGEQMAALNGKTYTLDETMTVIADASGQAHGLGGIIGGEESGCSEDTTDIVLECALFDPVRTACTGRSLGILSDARHRFERGVDPDFLREGMELASRRILELCGGEASGVLECGALPPARPAIAFAHRNTRRLTGVPVPVAEQQQILTRLGFGVEPDGTDRLQVQPPGWRPDIAGDADLVEEILRIKGYDQIPDVSLPRDTWQIQPAVPSLWLRGMRARRFLAARGWMEAVTFSFLSSDLAEKFGDGTAHPDLTLINPISSDLDQMRPSVIANLLRAAARAHANGLERVRLFEVGPIYRDATPEGQELRIGGLLSGAPPKTWDGAGTEPDALFAVRADLFDMLHLLGVPPERLNITRKAPDWLHPGRSGLVSLGRIPVAWFGALHPNCTAGLKLPGEVHCFECNPGALPPAKRRGPARPVLRLPELQAVRRDLAFLVAETLEAGQLIGALLSSDRRIQDVSVFDLYRGKEVPPGRKSVALRLSIQPEETSLRDEEIDAIIETAILRAHEKCHAVLRQ